MRHIRSLQTRLVLVVFVTMVSASVLTLFLYALLLSVGLMPAFLRAWPGGSLQLLVVSLVVGTFLAAMIARRYVQPSRNLIEANRLVAEGDFSVRLVEDPIYGEMNEMVRSFNHMTAELQSIEIFRKDFISNFSHEFKTPITSIRGFARQLQRDDLSPEQRREYTEIIVRESERLSAMAGNVLLLSRLESQQIVTEKVPFRLDEELRTALLLFEKEWTRKKLTLSLSLEETICMGNLDLLSHVWQNLLGNAVKFSPEGGELTVVCVPSGADALVSVGNQGDGMDEATQARIFEKFYQGDTSHSGEGNGLGLPLAKRIVEMSGGSISVNSRPGEGAVFTVRLPGVPSGSKS